MESQPPQSPPPTDESPADVDLDALTDLVWELLQDDLRIDSERRGERGTGRR